MAGIRLDCCGHVRKSLRLFPPLFIHPKRFVANATHINIPRCACCFLRADAEGWLIGGRQAKPLRFVLYGALASADASVLFNRAHGSFCLRKNAYAGAGFRPAAVGLASDAPRPRCVRTLLAFGS